MSIVRAAAVALVAFLETSAHAEPRALSYRFDVDGPIALSAGFAWFNAIALRETLGAPACSWCETNAFDRSVRDALRWQDTVTAQILVNVLGFGVGPTMIVSAGFFAAWKDKSVRLFLEDFVMMAEAATLASDVNLIFRFSAGRERPYASARSTEAKAQGNTTRDDNMSFYSGHATYLFALATAAGTIATMRGYRFAPLVWMIGMPFALVTSYLRIASDDHWMSDVLVGVGAGAAFGLLIPYFAHAPVRIVAAGSTIGVGGTF